MPNPEFRKQISIFLPVADWKAVRLEAARRRIPMTALCREWLAPGLGQLRREPPRPIEEEESE
ncbi:MAG: hypothetical protein SH850_07195 [Planctomycetaceae bacterium]|nr:hypothetical protein [Planctomycetaceae bacterium]